MVREAILKDTFAHSESVFMIDHITFNVSSNMHTTKRCLENKLIQGYSPINQNEKVLKPNREKKLIMFIEDMHMPGRD
jgi:hypothetical protein